jgi:hypothetical protein
MKRPPDGGFRAIDPKSQDPSLDIALDEAWQQQIGVRNYDFGVGFS